MSIGADPLVRLATGLAWPLVALLALIILRRPLTELLASLADLPRRGLITKISLAGITWEVADLKEAKVEWSGPFLPDVRSLVGAAEFTNSGIMGLLERVGVQQHADYAVFDLGTGRRWLTSRLYIFTWMLHRMHGLRYGVFLEGEKAERRRFVGVAPGPAIRWALAGHQPHLEQAAVEAFAVRYATDALGLIARSATGAISAHGAAEVILAFLQRVQAAILFRPEDLVDSDRLFTAIAVGQSPLATFLRQTLPLGRPWPSRSNDIDLLEALNRLLQAGPLYTAERFAGIDLSSPISVWAARQPTGDDLVLLNRRLLDEVYARPAQVQLFRPTGVTWDPSDPLSSLTAEWVKLADGITWEHAKWLDAAAFEAILGPELGRAHVRMADLQTRSRKEQVQLLLRPPDPVVALLDDRGRFEQLIDRRRLAEVAVRQTELGA